MSKPLDKSNFGYLGIDYQYRLVKCFVEDPHFFAETYQIIDSRAFTDVLLRTFVGVLQDYYEKEKNVPSYAVLKTRLKARSATDIESTEWEAFVDKLQQTSVEDWVFTKDNALKFFKQQEMIKAAHKILEIAGAGNVETYESCREIFENALKAGAGDNYGHSVYEMMDAALSDSYTVSIPTGIDGLDEALGGGLDKGKVGLIICPLGVGKTTLSTALASNAATAKSEANNNKGWKVLQIYFEDDDIDITRKHIGKLVSREACELKNCSEEVKRETIEKMNSLGVRDMIKDNLKMMHMRTGEISATGIKNEILKLANIGFKPDLVIIDYFECVAPERGGYTNDSEWSRQGKTMRTFENMAHDLNIALWIPTQGTKDSIGAETFGAEKAGGSVMKTQAAQVYITVGKTVEQASRNRATLFLGKNRGGKAQKIFRDIVFNNGTCEIRCDNATTYDTTLTWKDEKEAMDIANRNALSREAMRIVREQNAASR